MDSLHIGDKVYKLPEAITITQWQRVMQLTDDAMIIAEVFNVPLDEIKMMEPKTLEVGKAIAAATMTRPPINKLKQRDFRTLKFGEWVDLEMWFDRGIVPNLIKIGDAVCDDDVTGDTYYNDIIHIIQEFDTYRRRLYKQYPTLFSGGGDEEFEREVTQNKTPITQIWYDIIMMLGDGKFLNISKVTERPSIEAFNWLAWKKKQMIDQQQKAKKLELQRKVAKR